MDIIASLFGAARFQVAFIECAVFRVLSVSSIRLRATAKVSSFCTGDLNSTVRLNQLTCSNARILTFKPLTICSISNVISKEFL